jgi:hypothetical protein
MPGMNQPGALEGQGAGTVLTVHANKTVLISRLGIRNGFSNIGGGGLWIDAGATVTVTHSVIHENILGPNGSGGGILNFGRLTLDNTTVWGNRAGSNGAGAGIRNAFGTLTVNRSGLFGNSGGYAGAAISNNGLLVVSGSSIGSNTLALDTASNGAAVYHDGPFAATISETWINGNTAHNGGGGVYVVGDMTIRNSTIDSNVGIFGSGGGIDRVAGALTIENSTIYGNRAESGGGLADSASGMSGALTLTNVTITNNTSTTASGGGIFTLFGPNETAYSTIIAANVGGNCMFFLPGTSGGMRDGGYNLDDGVTCGFTTANNSLPNTSPSFDPAGLWPNGGPTRTVALLASSAAVDRIPVAVNGCGTSLTRDQRGVSRPFGPGCDIGAFELERVADTTPPQISSSIDPPPNANGWNRSSATIAWTVADAESGIASTSGCDTQTIATETSGTTLTCVAQNGAGLTASASVTIKLDQTPPVITFSGYNGAYTVDQQITITCGAADALSGIASSICPNVSGPAYTFPLGPNSVTASATDYAGNMSVATAVFTVSVSPDSLCSLTRQFVQGSAKYASVTDAQRAGANQLTAAACARLATLNASLTGAQRQAAISAYEGTIDALATIGWLTDAQRTMLNTLANAL